MKISEAASGVGEEMADVGMAMQRAVDKTENMRARANAMDELEASGAFDDQLSLDRGAGRHRPPAARADLGLGRRRRPRAPEGRARARARRAAAGARAPARATPRLRRRSRRDRPHRHGGPVRAPRRGRGPAQRARQRRSSRPSRPATRSASTTLFESMLELVRSDGTPVADDVLEESDVILPPPDLTFAEAGEQFTGDGLIPD